MSKIKGIIHNQKAIQVSVSSGARGRSAYEIWIEQGNIGTEDEYMLSLRGTDGIIGRDGIDGLDGKDGVNGTNGLDGKDGKGLDYTTMTPEEIASITGAQGEKGDTGDRGTDGLDGIKGDKGEKGEGLDYSTMSPEDKVSIKGDKGDTGNQGERGVQGEQGIKGEDGLDGTKGERGEQGIQGIQGEKGEAGSGGGDSLGLDNHIAEKVHLGEIHGFRLNVDQKLEYDNGTEWVEVKGGGYPVAAISTIVAKGIDMGVVLTWEDPIDVIIDDVTIAKWKSTKVMRKTGGYPIHENDGELVVSNGERDKYADEPFMDTGLVNEQEYFYALFPETEDGIVTISELSMKTVVPIKEIVIPGSDEFVGGNETAGYMGTVPATELFTGTEMASLCGISQGVAENDNSPWLKFMIDGKTIFKSQKGFRQKVAYETLIDAGCYDGEKIVTKKGTKYKVRLMDSSGKYVEGQLDGDIFHYSEWNRLILPIVAKNWTKPANVESDLQDWGVIFGSGSFGMNSFKFVEGHVKEGDGNYHMCKGVVYNNSSVVGRGGETVEVESLMDKGTYPSSNATWSPVLEVVED